MVHRIGVADRQGIVPDDFGRELDFGGEALVRMGQHRFHTALSSWYLQLHAAESASDRRYLPVATNSRGFPRLFLELRPSAVAQD
jgi:hypothetical protein